MNPGEVEVMACVEADHWWYRGLRDVMTRCLTRPDLRPPAHPKILDAGCGTGENLRSVFAPLSPSYLGGFDVSGEALEAARAKAPAADLYRGDICDPEIRERDLHIVASLDVVYIPGVERARPGLEKLVDALAPGGLLVLNLPAYQWLTSEHDVAIHTSERFTAGGVGTLFSQLGLSTEVLSYRLVLLFPAVALSRLSKRSALGKRPEEARSDLHAPPGPGVNRILLAPVLAENRLIARGWRMPFGSSVFAIGRKPGRAGVRPTR